MRRPQAATSHSWRTTFRSRTPKAVRISSISFEARYDIHVSTSGSSAADLVFFLSIHDHRQGLGGECGGTKTAVPLINIGPVDPTGANLNVLQSYTVEVMRNGNAQWAENLTSSGVSFNKPADNIGNKSIADYEAYAAHFIYEIQFRGVPRRDVCS